MNTSYLFISAISSTICCSAALGTVAVSSCSMEDSAEDRRWLKEGRAERRRPGREKEEDREFMTPLEGCA